MTLRDDSLTALKVIVDEVAGDVEDSEAAAKIGNYFNAYMNEERVKELGTSGYDDAAAASQRIVALETSLAGHHWTKEESRDADKIYNRMSLKGRDSPIIDGFTGEERFFLGHAQSSRIKWREQLIELLIKSDPHSPDVYRVNGVMPNVDDFYETYNVREGDALYRPEEERVRIWQ
jgi:predicted metalloendopeptidase